MGVLVYPRSQSVKPPAPRINWGHPLAAGLRSLVLFNEGGGVPSDLVRRNPLTTSGTPIWALRGESAGHADATTDYWTVGASDVIPVPTARVTVAIIRRKTDTVTRISGLFGVDTGTAGRRCSSHCPYSDDIVYWDFGGVTGANRLTYSWGSTTAIEKFVFIAGANGMSIWLDGARKANSGTAVTRTNGTENFRLNRAIESDGGDIEEIYYFALFDREWTGTEVRWWTANPYALFLRKPEIFSAAVGGLSFPFRSRQPAKVMLTR